MGEIFKVFMYLKVQRDSRGFSETRRLLLPLNQPRLQTNPQSIRAVNACSHCGTAFQQIIISVADLQYKEVL